MFARAVALFFVIISTVGFSAEENFILMNGVSDESLMELGPHVDQQMTPCSTFKIALSLMGFDSGVLQDEKNPVWLFQEGYDDFLESWKNPQTPKSWMKNSCVWFSRVLAGHLGAERFQSYLSVLDYGNQDASGGHTEAWLSSSIKISPREQVIFLRKLVQNKHPVSLHAHQMTKQIAFVEELPNGWKLFGKTGWSGSSSKIDGENELGWFIGWIEKEERYYSFAYNIRESKINLPMRVPRVKQLLLDSKVMD